MIANSTEFRNDHIVPFVNAGLLEVAIDICYERFLERNAEESGKDYYAELGIDKAIDEPPNSNEYRKNFGENGLLPTTAGLAVASRLPGHLEIFYRGKDVHLRHHWSYDSGKTWSQGDNLGGILTSAPAAISLDSKSIDCWYRGRDGKVWHRRWVDGVNNNQWSDEESPGWSLISAPAIGRRGGQLLKSFYRGEDNTLKHRSWHGPEWSQEWDLGGTVTSTLSATSSARLCTILLSNRQREQAEQE